MSQAYCRLYQVSIVSAKEVYLYCIICWTMSARILPDEKTQNMLRHSDKCILIFVCLSLCRTKKLIVDVVKIQPGETLTDILETPSSAAQVQ